MAPSATLVRPVADEETAAVVLQVRERMYCGCGLAAATWAARLAEVLASVMP